MKWINLADEQPSNQLAVIRDIDTKVCLNWMYIRKITPEFITATINEEFGDESYPSNEYEWLDESEESIAESFKKTMESILEEKKDIDKLLAEQHRNTRYDLIQLLCTKVANKDAKIFNFVMGLEKDIMNLKQRKP